MNSPHHKDSTPKWSWALKATLSLSASLAVASMVLTSSGFSHTHAQRRSERPGGAFTTPEPNAARPFGTILPVKVLFKWHGYVGPGGGGGGCEVPLGICLIIGFSPASAALTREEIAGGYGIALLQVKGDRLYMAFNREAALPDGTIRITKNVSLGPDVSRGLGYERITLKAGAYKVNKAVRPFGETWVNIEKSNEQPKEPSGYVTCYTYQNTTGYGSGCGVACTDGTNYPMSCTADIFRSR